MVILTEPHEYCGLSLVTSRMNVIGGLFSNSKFKKLVVLEIKVVSLVKYRKIFIG